jgi:sulfur-oxidizing protein SoxY
MTPPLPHAPPVASRRTVLVLGTGALATLVVRPAAATPEALQAAIADFTKGAVARPGRVRLDIPLLVENGNAVPVTVRVDSPMTVEDHVRRIALFNEKNPQPNIAVFYLSPRNGRAQVSTRIRLGDSQIIIAVAELSDGSLWSAQAELIVTLPACAED